jgi:hypothetical protein
MPNVPSHDPAIDHPRLVDIDMIDVIATFHQPFTIYRVVMNQGILIIYSF